MEELKLRKKQKEKELATLQPDNKRLHELLGGVQQEVDAVQRRMKQPAQRRVGLFAGIHHLSLCVLVTTFKPL